MTIPEAVEEMRKMLDQAEKDELFGGKDDGPKGIDWQDLKDKAESIIRRITTLER